MPRKSPVSKSGKKRPDSETKETVDKLSRKEYDAALAITALASASFGAKRAAESGKYVSSGSKTKEGKVGQRKMTAMGDGSGETPDLARGEGLIKSEGHASNVTRGSASDTKRRGRGRGRRASGGNRGLVSESRSEPVLSDAHQHHESTRRSRGRQVGTVPGRRRGGESPRGNPLTTPNDEPLDMTVSKQSEGLDEDFDSLSRDDGKDSPLMSLPLKKRKYVHDEADSGTSGVESEAAAETTRKRPEKVNPKKKKVPTATLR